MGRYKKIVVAVDLGEGAEHVLEAAASVAASFRGELTLVHVSDVHVTGYSELMSKNHIVNDMQVRQSIYPKLRPLAKKHQIPTNRIHILFGKVAEVLSEFVEEQQSDLVIIGCDEHSGLGAILSSKGQALTRKAGCDVLRVKRPMPEAP